MKTLFSFLFISMLSAHHMHAQLYASGSAGALIIGEYTTSGSPIILPGTNISFGYYDFMYGVDGFVMAGWGLPKKSQYASDYFGAGFIGDTVTVDETVNWYSLGLGGTYWLGEANNVPVMFGVSAGFELIYQRVEQNSTWNGDPLTYSYSGSDINSFIGMKLMLLPTDVLGVGFDALFKTPINYDVELYSVSGVYPSKGVGGYLRLSVLYYIE